MCSPPIDCDVFVSLCASPPSLSRRMRSIGFLHRQVTSRFSPSHSVEDSLSKKNNNNLSAQIGGGQVSQAVFNSRPEWQDGVSDMSLASVFFLKVWAGASTKWLGGINATREWERQKKVVVFYFSFGGGSAETVCVLHLFKRLQCLSSEVPLWLNTLQFARCNLWRKRSLAQADFFFPSATCKLPAVRLRSQAGKDPRFRAQWQPFFVDLRRASLTDLNVISCKTPCKCSE